MNRRPILTLLAGTLLAGCSSSAFPQPAAEETAVKVATMPVVAVTLEETVTGIGTCAAIPDHFAEVSPVLEGQVRQIVAQEGQPVHAGDVLVRLDDRQAREELAQLRAAAAEAEASLTVLKALPREPDQRVAKLEMQQASEARKLAQSTLDALTPLRQRKEVSAQQYFEAQQALAQAELRERLAEARFDVLMQGPRPEAVAEAEAKVAAARAAVQTAEVRLSYLQLCSPLNGFVDRVLCHAGQTLAPGATVAHVVDPSELYVTVWLPAPQAQRIRVGMPAQVVPPQSGDVPKGATAAGEVEQSDEGGEASADDPPPSGRFQGTVVFVGRQTSTQTGNLPVKVLLSDPTGALALGLTVQVDFIVGERPEALVVPETAVVDFEGRPFVYVVRDGKAVRLAPTFGLRQQGLVEIQDALRAGEPVIVRGAYNLPDGIAVQVMEPSSEASESTPST
jgi:HlyD family secretion protein